MKQPKLINIRNLETLGKYQYGKNGLTEKMDKRRNK